MQRQSESEKTLCDSVCCPISLHQAADLKNLGKFSRGNFHSILCVGCRPLVISRLAIKVCDSCRVLTMEHHTTLQSKKHVHGRLIPKESSDLDGYGIEAVDTILCVTCEYGIEPAHHKITLNDLLVQEL